MIKGYSKIKDLEPAHSLTQKYRLKSVLKHSGCFYRLLIEWLVIFDIIQPMTGYDELVS